MATQAESQKSGEHSAELEHPEKLGEQTKDIPYDRSIIYSNADDLEEAVDKPDKVWVIEYYDHFQGYQPFNWADVSETPGEAAKELRKLCSRRPGTSFRAVRLDRKEVTQ